MKTYELSWNIRLFILLNSKRMEWVQDKKLNLNWESNPSPLAVYTNAQTIMPSRFKWRNSWRPLSCENPPHLLGDISAICTFWDNSQFRLKLFSWNINDALYTIYKYKGIFRHHWWNKSFLSILLQLFQLMGTTYRVNH